MTYTPRPSGPPHGGPAPLLIEAASGHADQDLAAAAFGVMDVPVVAAARLKGHIEPTCSAETGARKLLPVKYCAKPSLGAPMGKTMDAACRAMALSPEGAVCFTDIFFASIIPARALARRFGFCYTHDNT